MNSWRKFRNQLIEAGYTDEQIEQMSLGKLYKHLLYTDFFKIKTKCDEFRKNIKKVNRPIKKKRTR